MKDLYLDMCVLKRPFDRVNTSKIQLEADAAVFIFRGIEEGKYDLISSDVLLYENRKNPNKIRRETVSAVLSTASRMVTIDSDVIKKARQIQSHGLQAIDALHIALAEKAHVNLITDNM